LGSGDDREKGREGTKKEEREREREREKEEEREGEMREKERGFTEHRIIYRREGRS